MEANVLAWNSFGTPAKTVPGSSARTMLPGLPCCGYLRADQGRKVLLLLEVSCHCDGGCTACAWEGELLARLAWHLKASVRGRRAREDAELSAEVLDDALEAEADAEEGDAVLKRASKATLSGHVQPHDAARSRTAGEKSRAPTSPG
eukprot:5844785-Pleurochrysis_carterae.AAC.1